MRVFLALLLMLILSVAEAQTPVPQLTGKVTVLQAASLTEFLKRAQDGFQQVHPDVTIEREAGASMVLIRQITDLSKEADIIAVADRTLMQSFLVPDYVEKPVDFLTEQIAIVATENSRDVDKITAENWPDILLQDGIEIGLSDPNTAPAGYRTKMVWQLAEKYYKKPGLYQKLQQRLPMKNIRPNATALLTLLKTGELDYVFDYASLAAQNGLKVVLLPPQINLGDRNYAEQYKTAFVEIPSDKPGTVKTLQGEPIVYTMGLLKSAPNPKAAQAFLDYALGPEGRDIMKALGMTPLPLIAK